MSPWGAVPSDDSLNMQSFTLLFSANNFLMHREDLKIRKNVQEYNIYWHTNRPFVCLSLKRMAVIIFDLGRSKKTRFLGDFSQICLNTHPPQGFCEIWENER